MTRLTTLTAGAALMSTTALADVTTQTFTFENEGATLSGTLYLPGGHDGSALPTVVVTGAWTSVEEQMPATYAHAMVERGLAAVTFDFRGWGKSGDLADGQRFIESPSAKTSDIKAAFDAVALMPTTASIHGLGICASAGYMVDAVAQSPDVASIGLVAPWLQNREIVETVYGGPEGVAGLIEAGRAADAAGGQIIPAAGPEGADGVLMPLGGYYYEPTLGAVPEYDNRWNNAGWEGWLTYYPADHAAALSQPLAIVHSQDAAIPQGVTAFLEGLAGEATVRWLDDVTQFDFYHVEEDVIRASDTMAAHFKATIPDA